MTGEVGLLSRTSAAKRRRIDFAPATPLVEKEETKIVPTLTVKLAPGCTRKVWLVYFAPNRVDLHAREETQIPLATTEPEVVCF